MALPRAVVVTLVAFALVLPVSSASWSMMGNSEPNSRHDVEDHWMFLVPDTSDTGNQVYFNGYISAQAPAAGVFGSGPSLGVGALQTGLNPMSYQANAVLGVWKDCNHDGYVGDSDAGLWEYRSELLFAESQARGFSVTGLCAPRGSTSADASWHNDGTWVRELVPIAWPNSTGVQPDPIAITDVGARVWYDNEYYDDAPIQSCSLNPPTGSLHSTGGILFFADCTDNYHGTELFSLIADQTPVTQPLSFSDHPHDQYASDSELNQANPWGDQQDGSYVQAWDCSQPTTPVNGNVNLSAPNSNPSLDPTGSPGGTVNATASGADRCDRRTDTTGGGRAGGLAHDPYALETPVAQSTLKRHTASTLYPSPSGTTGAGTRPSDLRVTVPYYENATVNGNPVSVAVPLVGGTVVDAGAQVSPLVGANAPLNGGTHVTSTEGVWHDTVVWTSKYVSRHYTFYAYVSPGAVSAYALMLPPGGTGAYQGNACGASFTNDPPAPGQALGTVNEHAGVDCNIGNWWLDANGVDVSPRSPYLGQDPTLTGPCTPANSAPQTGANSRGCYQVGAFPGSPFNLRDVDCVDDTVGPARTLDQHYVIVPGTVMYDMCDDLFT